MLPFREAGQGDGLAADFLMHAGKVTGGAEAAGALERGVEQGKELEGQIIAAGQLGFRRRRFCGAGQPGRQAPLKLREQLPVVKRRFGKRRWGVGSDRDHAPSKPEVGPRGQ